MQASCIEVDEAASGGGNLMDIEKLDINAVCFGILCNFTPVCGEEKAKEAVALIRSLQAENERLRTELQKSEHDNVNLTGEMAKVAAELEQVKREKDVAIEQLHGHCPACNHYTPNHNEGLCRFCCFEVARDTNVEINDNWEWRGQKED